ncbi:MAG: hypothetical protein C0606_08805 [Hyphomicrobiales bacterium]|nr:MAG: hypothetical protein C0606_08805 [Hyphomicrobiales bacterium]
MRTNPGSASIDPEILGPEFEEEATASARDSEKVRTRFWPTLKKAARQIPFMDELVAAYFCAMDPATPRRVRLTLMGALAYFVLPVDAIPDFLLGVGYTDDAGVLMAAIAAVSAHIRPAHRNAAREALADKGLDDGGIDDGGK